MIESNPSRYHPEKSKYLSAKIIAKIFSYTGDKGKLAVGIYEYLRWVDDCIDEGNESKSDKFLLLDRQVSLLRGNPPDDLNPMESYFLDLPWDSVPGKTEAIKQQCCVLVGAIDNDLQFVDQPRTNRQLRHNSIRTVYPAVEILNLIMNGREFRGTKEFINLMVYWDTLGSQIDLEKDLASGFIKVPTNNSNADPNDIESVITKEEFYRLKKNSLKGVITNSTAFFDAHMPFIQQLACFMYTARVLSKGFLKAQYPKQIRTKVSEGPNSNLATSI